MPALPDHPRRYDPWPCVAALLALIPLAALLQPGLPATADGQVHLLRTLEVARLLRDGTWYPRWAPDFYLGYGYPFFNFYAPGAHLAAALLALAGLGVVRGVAALQALALVLYPLGAYLAVRSILPDDRVTARAWRGPAALVGAAVYLYAPLRFRELFVQGNLSQWLALALLPWCAWLLVSAARSGGLGRIVAAGVLLAALLYAHHPSAFLAWPALLVFALAVAWSAGRGRARGSASHVPAVLGAFLLAAALAAPFWLPSIVEMRDVNLNAIATGSFNAALNLLPWRELLALPAIQDAAALNPPMPNSLGSVQVLLAVAGAAVAGAWLAGRGRGARPAAAGAEEAWAEDAAEAWSPWQAGLVLITAAVLLLISLLLMLPVAAPAWAALPLARFIAFPWRLLGPALLWSALLSGAALYAVPARGRLPALALLLILVPAGVAPYLFPRPFAPVPEPGLASIRSYELGGGARATASANEYLPRWVSDAQPPELPQDGTGIDVAALPDGSRAQRLSQRGLDYRYALDLPDAADVLVQRFYFPGWQAWVDDRPAAIEPAGPYGLIAISVPAGRHELRVAFGSTPARTAGRALALAGLAAVGLLAIASRLRKSRGAPVNGKVSRPRRAYNHRAWLAAALVILSVTVVKLALIGPYTTWFRRQSSPDQPAGMQHAVRARFANGVELIGYDLAEPEVRQGEDLAVRLYWRTWAPKATDARPFLHLDAPTGEVTWANQTKLNAGDKPMTAWPPGFFVVDDYQLAVDAATPPVVGQLRVGLLDHGGQLVPLADGSELAGLGPARVDESVPRQAASLPNREQVYQLGPAIRLAGHEIRPTADPPGIQVTLYWQALAPVLADYTTFVHVHDAAGQMIGQQDRPPLHGWYPTHAWKPGQIISDTYTIPLPAGALAGNLDVAAGLYTPTNGQRAPVTDGRGLRQANDEIILPIKQD